MLCNGIVVHIKVERESARSLESDVAIALTLESGERRQKTLKASTTLADMVKAFEQSGEWVWFESTWDWVYIYYTVCM